MKINIIGSVFDGKNYLKGEVELPDKEALRLLNDGYAEVVNNTEKSAAANNKVKQSKSDTSNQKK